jgi:hypothetical protein
MALSQEVLDMIAFAAQMGYDKLKPALRLDHDRKLRSPER